ncbi:MAG: TPM domain-containing protein [Clostridia bacterium]|nr:TPM domain-containing protein [Clostridia bacterium]
MKKYLKLIIFTVIIASVCLVSLTASAAQNAVYSYGYSSSNDGYSGYPSWYKQGFGPSDVYHNDPSEPRLVDYAGIFTPSEESSLKRQLSELKSKFNMDFVIVTDNSDYGLGHGMYAAEFFDMNGYGVGENYSGVVMFICMEPGNRGWWTAGTGNAEKYFTEKNVNHMDDDMEPYMVDGEYAAGVSKYFSDVDVLFTKGRFPMSAAAVIGCLVTSMIIGAIAGLGFLGSASSTMRGVATAVQASQYLNADSFKVNAANDIFLRTNVTKTLIESSSSGSRGGGSSFSGGYHSSGGHSFSGGGRRF